METQTPASSPRRRWLRFSLRALLVFMLLISLPLGWLGTKLANKRAETRLVKQIEASGGKVEYGVGIFVFSTPGGYGTPKSGLHPGLAKDTCTRTCETRMWWRENILN